MALFFKIFASIVELSEAPLHKIKKVWGDELGEDDDWNQVMILHFALRSMKYNLKLSFTFILPNFKPSKCYPRVTDTCNRCDPAPVNTTHVVWSCGHL